MEIYPHNLRAIDNVLQCFEAGQQRAAVVHATGTGKSVIAAQVAVSDFRDQAPGAYRACRKNGWCEDCMPHMKHINVRKAKDENNNKRYHRASQ